MAVSCGELSGQPDRQAALTLRQKRRAILLENRKLLRDPTNRALQDASEVALVRAPILRARPVTAA
jgi:hypothetical protein